MSNDNIPTTIWTKFIGGSGSDEARALTTGKDGAIYLAGVTTSSFDGQTIQGISKWVM